MQKPLLFNSNTTHCQFKNTAHMSLEILDLDFDKINVFIHLNAKSSATKY